MFSALADGDADYGDRVLWDVGDALRGPTGPLPGLAELMLVDGDAKSQAGAGVLLNWLRPIDERDAAAQPTLTDEQ